MESSKKQLATFAGGCFWCMEPPFEGQKGVLDVTAGYIGGTVANPTYEQVSSGQTGHAEAVQITFDPSQVSYQDLLEIFWRNIDPTTEDAQFADQGTQYRTAIFYHSDEQKKLAQASKDKLAASGKFKSPLVTEIVPATGFYRAEEYHQDYFKKQPFRYKNYSVGSGRAGFRRIPVGRARESPSPLFVRRGGAAAIIPKSQNTALGRLAANVVLWLFTEIDALADKYPFIEAQVGKTTYGLLSRCAAYLHRSFIVPPPTATSTSHTAVWARIYSRVSSSAQAPPARVIFMQPALPESAFEILPPSTLLVLTSSITA